jgi:hypothetical protein
MLEKSILASVMLSGVRHISQHGIGNVDIIFLNQKMGQQALKIYDPSAQDAIVVWEIAIRLMSGVECILPSQLVVTLLL